MTTSLEATIDPDTVVWSDRLAPDDARPLVVLLHGRGSNERDLASLVPYLPGGPVYASLRAPFPEGPGWAWFASGSPGVPGAATARASTEAVVAWLDTIPTDGPIAVAGFSQGGAMALELLQHSPERFAGYVNLAGFVIGDREADAALAALARPVFWGRDPADSVIPTSAIERTRAWLPAHSSLTVREYQGVGHSLSGEELADVSAFLTDVFGLDGSAVSPGEASAPSRGRVPDRAPDTDTDAGTAERLVLDLVGSHPDFPRPGILFRDLTPVFAHPGALAAVARALLEQLSDDGRPVDAIVGVESRGFAIAAAMAVDAGCGMIPVRKAGKLPGEVLAEAYALEYGDDELELQAGTLPAGSRVLLVDDLLATGGTLAASVRLLERSGLAVAGIGVVLELEGLNGRAAIAEHRVAVVASLPA